MSKIIKIFVVLAIVVLLIIVLGNYFLQQQLKQGSEVDFSEIISQIEELSSEQILKPQTGEVGDKKFISPDKKLEIEYSLRWIEVPSESLKRVFANEQIQKYKITNLLLVQRFEISGEFAQLIIDQAFFDIEKSFEQIINEMQKANLEQGWNMKVIKSETKNKYIAFEASYEKNESNNIYSKERIIFFEPEESNKKAYLISFITLDKDWLKFKQEADKIFDSIRIIF